MGSFASSTTAASNSTPTSWKEVSVRLCSIEKTRCSLATIKGRRTGRPSPHLSRPANCMVSIRKPTSPTCSQSSSISGLHRASTSSCPRLGQHSVPPIASRRNHEGASRSRSIQRKNQAIRTVGSENRLPYNVTTYESSGGLHAHIVFLGTPDIVERLRASDAWGEIIQVDPVTDPSGLARKYL